MAQKPALKGDLDTAQHQLPPFGKGMNIYSLAHPEFHTHSMRLSKNALFLFSGRATAKKLRHSRYLLRRGRAPFTKYAIFRQSLHSRSSNKKQRPYKLGGTFWSRCICGNASRAKLAPQHNEAK